MASPFKVFRKHQKVMLVVLGLLAMISFVVLPIFLDMLSVARVRDRVVVSTSEYGDLKESGVEILMYKRRVVSSFLQRIAQEISMAGGNPQRILREIGRIGPPDEEVVVNTWLMAQQARRLGLVISDEAINRYLTDMTTGQGLSAEKVYQVLESLRITDRQLFECLRHELLALRLQDMFSVSLAAATPGQRWQDYKRLNLKVALELVSIPAADFAAEVAAPDEETLKAFYERYRDRPEDPTSPEPGFKIPKKVDLEYVRADYEKLVDPDSVPEADVVAYYEKNKDRYYRKEQLPEVEPESTEPPSAEPEAEPAERESTQPESEPTGQEAAEAEPPEPDPGPKDEAAERPPAGQGEAAPSGQAAPEGAPPETGTETAEKGESDAPQSREAAAAEEEPAGSPEPADVPPGDPEAEGQPEATHGAEGGEQGGVFRLASLAGEEQADSTAQTGSQAGPADQGHEPGSRSPEGSGAAGEEPPAGSGDEPPGDQPGKPEATSAEQEMERIVGQAVGPSKAAAEELEYMPLEQVEGQIRNTLARQRAQSIRQQVVDRLRDRMDAFHQKWLQVFSEDESAKPAKPDLQALLEEVLRDGGQSASGAFSVRRTGLISALEMARLDIGQSTVSARLGLVELAFRSLDVFQPAESQDLDGNYYLCWKVAESEERVPEFDEVREKVELKWREVQARQLAKRWAQERLVRRARGTLADALAAALKEAEQSGSQRDLERVQKLVVVETEPFTWNTYGTIDYLWNPRPPEVSQIRQRIDDQGTSPEDPPEAVVLPGDTFMKAVFEPKDESGQVRDIQIGDVGVAFNQPQTMVYVYRVIDMSPSPETLRKQFFVENPDRYYYVGAQRRGETYRAWQGQLRAAAGFRWERPPRRANSG